MDLRSRIYATNQDKDNQVYQMRVVLYILLQINVACIAAHFQTTFRIQSRWVRLNDDNSNRQEVIKSEAYTFDFA